MREIRRRLSELKKENEELKILVSISGKNRYEYEIKVNILFLKIENFYFFDLFIIRFNN
jgi:hypothetical protein